jgi:hypothetical protein
MSEGQARTSRIEPAFATLTYLAVGLAFTAISCGDPVPDSVVQALGPEDPNVPPGPSHRPGQPCLACHRDGGKARAFTLGGTVYADLTSQKPIGNVAVIIIDSAATTFTVSTNCAGNFYVQGDQFTPVYPFWVSLRAGPVRDDMASPVYREGSCAACHSNPRSAMSPGNVYLIDDPTTQMAPASGCP